MACRFFRIIIIGTDEDKLNNIKNWADTIIDNNDLEEKLDYSSYVYQEFESENFIFTCDMYIKQSVQVNKYRDIIRDRFIQLNKTGLISAKVIQYDNCSHNEEIHHPCEPTVRMEWSA